jgi:flagellar hook-associated protein 3 FlgL
MDPDMRVTSEMMVQNSLHRLHTRLERYQETQSRLATGRRILKPSDDPSGTARVLSMRAAMRSREQEMRNAADANTWLSLADSGLQAATERLGRARELALRGGNALSAEEGQALAEEVATIRAELVSIANSRSRGRPLFAGYSSGDAVLFDGAAWQYGGDDGAITRRVGENDVVRINVSGEEVFGFTDGDEVFGMLDELEDALRALDSNGATGMLGRIDDARRRVGDALATVGATTNWADSALARTEDAHFAARVQLSEIIDVDVAEAIMDLQTQQVAYETTLQALARALPPTLASFLR